MSFSKLPEAPPDTAFALIAAFRADQDPEKVDLCPGFYRDAQAKPWILPSVKEAEELLHNDPSIDHEHLPQLGHPGLIAGAQRIVFGDANTDRIASIQTVSGTGSNHLAARFLRDITQPRSVWFSDPTWVNHTEIWDYDAPDVEQRTYPYYLPETFALNFEGMTKTLREQAQRGDVVLLHACAHNPTGLDLSKQQWKVVGDICEEKGLFPVFDSAYQGFASGSVPNDAVAMRHFLDRCNGKMEFAVAQSFSKNFGLYGERIGCLHVVTESPELARKVENKLKKMTRAEISTCPSYGARIIATILGRKELQEQWYEDLLTMSGRMKSMRHKLYDLLISKETPGKWDHLLTDIGMFSMTGLSKEQCLVLKDKHHIYLLPSGRLSVTGLTEHNVKRVAAAMDEVIRSA